MKAIQITSYDGPRGLTYDTLPEPEPAPEQVALNVEFAGANYVEALFAGGFVPKPLPWVPGIEAAGRIRASSTSSATDPRPDPRTTAARGLKSPAARHRQSSAFMARS